MIGDTMRVGLVQVELTSAEIEVILGMVNDKGIFITNLTKESDVSCRFVIRFIDYSVVNKICKSRGSELKILKKRGLYWSFLRISHRPVLTFGLILMVALTTLLPTRVLFVRVEGNEQIPTRRIIEAAQDCGICFGVSRRMVRSEKMKNALLSTLPQLQWAGINTEGCTAVISVREGKRNKKEKIVKTVSNIVASRDGYILAGTVLNGNALFQPGQTVTAGQVLISGYTDCGIYIQAVRAEGEILAQTKRHLNAISLLQYQHKGRSLDVKRKYSLIIRKKRINLWKDSGISDGVYGRIYKQYYVTLPGGFKLPLSLCIEEFVECKKVITKLSFEKAKAQLSAFADSYLTELMIAGKITDKAEAFFLTEDSYCMNGSYTCVEMIGREVAEQNGEANGKTD